MSDSMPGHFAKGSVLAEAERVLADASVRTFIENAVASGQTLQNVITEPKVGFDAVLRDHLVQHVLDENSSKNYWPQHPRKDAILREGLLKCIQQAAKGTTPLPIDLGWVCAGDRFHFIAMESDEQVTGLILSPMLPAGIIDLPTPHLEPFWVVAEQGEAAAIVVEGSGPVWDPDHPGQTRPRLPDEKPILTKTGTSDVCLVQLRRSSITGEP